MAGIYDSSMLPAAKYPFIDALAKYMEYNDCIELQQESLLSRFKSIYGKIPQNQKELLLRLAKVLSKSSSTIRAEYMSEDEFRLSCPGEDCLLCKERGLKFLTEVSTTVLTQGEGIKRRRID